VYALPRLLARNKLSLGEFDYYEIHEAFASTVLTTLAAWEDGDFCRQRLGLSDALGSIGLVHLDGHLDLYDGITSPTGEAADMPVSVAFGLGPKRWVELAGGASVAADRAALVGFRDREESLGYGMLQPETLEPAPMLHSLADLRAAGPGRVAAEVAAALGERGPFWLHFDVDVLDPNTFPATDYLMPGGLDWEECGAVLGPMFSSPALVGVSLGCYNPEKDPDRACGRALVDALAG
jgi:arginase